jgi:outer membrane protein OmpA-like peptidoglycan-associated protein
MRHWLGGLVLAATLAGCAAFQVQEAPRDYIVFFDYNTADLSASAQSIVANAASAAKSLDVARVDIVGHNGSARTPDKLADARFVKIEDALAAGGVSRSLFKRSTLTDAVPLPDTAQRRIEIHLVAPDPR